MTSAVVVGGGPNGLAAAALLAGAGLRVTLLEAADEAGGGVRSHEAILPGLVHDHCSAIHPMAVSSPAMRALGLERHGLRWLLPDIDCVLRVTDHRQLPPADVTLLGPPSACLAGSGTEAAFKRFANAHRAPRRGG